MWSKRRMATIPVPWRATFGSPSPAPACACASASTGPSGSLSRLRGEARTRTSTDDRTRPKGRGADDQPVTHSGASGRRFIPARDQAPMECGCSGSTCVLSGTCDERRDPTAWSTTVRQTRQALGPPRRESGEGLQAVRPCTYARAPRPSRKARRGTRSGSGRARVLAHGPVRDGDPGLPGSVRESDDRSP